jgi:hypothetical protein
MQVEVEVVDTQALDLVDLVVQVAVVLAVLDLVHLVVAALQIQVEGVVVVQVEAAETEVRVDRE